MSLVSLVFLANGCRFDPVVPAVTDQDARWDGSPDVDVSDVDSEVDARVDGTPDVQEASVPHCGNDIVEGTEECDGTDLAGHTCENLGFEGGTLACASDCTLDTSGCIPTGHCGDDTVDPNAGEECDDGNTTDGDGCSGGCQTEEGWNCQGSPSVCTPVCGDGLVVGDEECDGTNLNGTGCSNLSGYEGGNLGCTESCTFDVSRCIPEGHCGNGTIETAYGEVCDDGNTADGDGCNSDCQVEDYFVCEGSPSVCTCRVLVLDGAAQPGDGKTWSSALASVQGGVDTASNLVNTLAISRCQVWVGHGNTGVYPIYDEPGRTLRLRAHVDVYGGFCGTETYLRERQPENCPTILAGGAASDPVPAHLSDHVVSAGAAVDSTLDGFAIQGGTDGSRGGGVFVDGGTLTIRHCLIRWNKAEQGGGISADNGATIMLEGSWVVDSTAYYDNSSSAWGNGGAVSVTGGSTLTVTDATFMGNIAEVEGGAIWVGNTNSQASFQRVTFRGNMAGTDGGALWVGSSAHADLNTTAFVANYAEDDGGAVNAEGVVTAENCTFVQNGCGSQDTSSDGGAVRVAYGGSGSFTTCTFDSNHSARAGGGLMVREATATLISCAIQNNIADGDGGGVALRDNASILTRDCTVQGNQGASGGGVFITNGSARMVDTTIEWNTADNLGGGLALLGGTLDATRCTFESNTSHDGGGVAVTPNDDGTYATAHLWHAIFRSNSADRYSGGLRVDAGGTDWAAVAVAKNCLFYDNSAGTQWGGAASSSNSGRLTLVNCTVFGNHAQRSPLGAQYGGLVVYYGTIVAQNCIVWGNDGSDLHLGYNSGSIGITYSDVQDPDNVTLGTGCISDPPQFQQPGNGDLHLRAGSPCIDVGDNRPVDWPSDLDGAPRIVNGTVDMGAYEYH